MQKMRGTTVQQWLLVASASINKVSMRVRPASRCAPTRVDLLDAEIRAEGSYEA
jgi:hypothetical protein